MTFVVTQACVDVQDKSCTQVCPADCIYEGGRMMYINPDQCIDCGACEEVCPMSAIRYDGDLTDADLQFVDINAEFFDGMETPKGARKLGRIDRDVPFVASLPRTTD
ncbi:ferredoxin family protein [Streptomyces sp. NBC_01239]|uniref:ferredoxin n=1 Tax=Streptomyces sp. NBC_01239 TaxID=2903792 RepID=UPI00225239C1|nr:ferredoxin [Streptomyces sp. NBC_01239]MCX4816299.1 ferredoxin family protein [Streptomyces sp. NBC_01239]